MTGNSEFIISSLKKLDISTAGKRYDVQLYHLGNSAADEICNFKLAIRSSSDFRHHKFRRLNRHAMNSSDDCFRFLTAAHPRRLSLVQSMIKLSIFLFQLS